MHKIISYSNNDNVSQKKNKYSTDDTNITKLC